MSYRKKILKLIEGGGAMHLTQICGLLGISSDAALSSLSALVRDGLVHKHEGQTGYVTFRAKRDNGIDDGELMEIEELAKSKGVFSEGALARASGFSRKTVHMAMERWERDERLIFLENRVIRGIKYATYCLDQRPSSMLAEHTEKLRELGEFSIRGGAEHLGVDRRAFMKTIQEMESDGILVRCGDKYRIKS